jgi:L-ascorbate metabolism protein UlaG (beta-lactamase superfamily)
MYDLQLSTEIKTAQLFVRINGTLPDSTSIGNEDNSERAAEIKRLKMFVNTSASVFSISSSANGQNEVFHLLIDVGEGVVKSLERGISNFETYGKEKKLLSDIPDAVLITHAHDNHLKELPDLLKKANGAAKSIFKVYCTKGCLDQIMVKFPHLAEGQAGTSFNIIQPGEVFEAGPFSVIPILADHGENLLTSGSVIYVVKHIERKMIFGWDFLTLPNVDENLLWNPDLLILGTQSYNPHPETGMISVSEAYHLVRRWNAKVCYLVHYSGLKDSEEAKNQWFRGPVKAMTIDDLQKTIDLHLRATGNNGRFKITVAREGMVWSTKDSPQYLYEYDENIPIGNTIEIEALQQYVFKIDKDDEGDKLKVMIEDTINRYSMEFDKPRRDKNKEYLVHAQGVKGMLARGPELTMELINSESKENQPAIKISVLKGRKYVFQDEILINGADAIRLGRYFTKNFSVERGN